MAEEKKEKGLKGLAHRTGRFFRDMRGEMKRVVWPTKKQVRNNTIVVLVVVVISSLFIGGLDFIFKVLVDLVLRNA